MARMKTFLLYALAIVGFIFISEVMEDGLVMGMYKKMNGQTIPSSAYNVAIEDVDARATNVNGYLNFRIKNNSSSSTDLGTLKIDLFSKRGNHAMTKYVKITDIEPGGTKDYQVKFKGKEIAGYRVSILTDDEVPDRSNILTIFGYEIDLSDFFGMDIRDFRIFGRRLGDLVDVNYVKGSARNIWVWFIDMCNSVPWWGYAIAAGLIIWYMPKGYLLGIFPF